MKVIYQNILPHTDANEIQIHTLPRPKIKANSMNPFSSHKNSSGLRIDAFSCNNPLFSQQAIYATYVGSRMLTYFIAKNAPNKPIRFQIANTPTS